VLSKEFVSIEIDVFDNLFETCVVEKHLEVGSFPNLKYHLKRKKLSNNYIYVFGNFVVHMSKL